MGFEKRLIDSIRSIIVRVQEDSEQRELPHDVISMHILTRLPIASIIRFKSVSKQWYSTLCSPHFGNVHFKLSSFSYPSSPTHFMIIIQINLSFFVFKYNKANTNGNKNRGNKLFKLEHSFGVEDNNNVDDNDAREIITTSIGKGNYIVDYATKHDPKLRLIESCNGLVCIACHYDFILWNPITQQFKKFDSGLDNNLINSSTTYLVSWGFGYVSSVDDYKIVRMIELPQPQEILAHVFSFKSNKWRRFDLQQVLSRGFDESGKCGYSFQTKRGVLCDESLHWMVANTQTCSRRVVAFDLIQETFETYQNSQGFRGRFLCAMRGCLSIYSGNWRGDAYIDMYEPSSGGRTRYEEKESILLSRNLGSRDVTGLIHFSGNGNIFVLKGNFGAYIGVVDTSSHRPIYKELVRFEEEGNNCFASYVPSLVSPFASVVNPVV